MTPPTSAQTVTAEDLEHVRSALATLSDPLTIVVAGHLTGTARALAIVHAMRDIAATAALRLPTLTSSLTEARVRELEARLRAITNPSALAGSQAAKMIDPTLGPLTPIAMVVTKGQLQDARAALSQTEEGPR